MFAGLPDDRKGRQRVGSPDVSESQLDDPPKLRSKKDVVLRRGRKQQQKNVFRVGWRSGVCWCFCWEKTGCKDESCTFWIFHVVYLFTSIITRVFQISDLLASRSLSYLESSGRGTGIF